MPSLPQKPVTLQRVYMPPFQDTGPDTQKHNQVWKKTLILQRKASEKGNAKSLAWFKVFVLAPQAAVGISITSPPAKNFHPHPADFIINADFKRSPSF